MRIHFWWMFWSALIWSFPVSTIPEDNLGQKGWDMSAWSPADRLCHLTATATCAAQKVPACAALSLWDWCMNIPFTALTGLSDTPLPIWLIFPSAADGRFYTKITEWVFLVRKMRLFCSWVTFLWSLLIPLPRSSDVLAKKDCKRLPGITFRQVCLLLASTY